MKRNLIDTPFSIERLFVWAIGIYGLIGVITLCVLTYQGKEIAPQVQSLTMFCLGAFAARIERRK